MRNEELFHPGQRAKDLLVYPLLIVVRDYGYEQHRDPNRDHYQAHRGYSDYSRSSSHSRKHPSHYDHEIDHVSIYHSGHTPRYGSQGHNEHYSEKYGSLEPSPIEHGRSLGFRGNAGQHHSVPPGVSQDWR